MSETRVDSPLAISHIPLSFDNSDPKGSALKIACELHPSWKETEGEIDVVQFTDGITNAICKVTKQWPGKTEAQNDDEAVLVRCYGNGTDLILDREKEIKAQHLLSSRGLAPPLFARFKNGFVYGYVQGHVCSPEDLRKPEVYRQSAKTLGEWHALLPISAITSTPNLEEEAYRKHCGLKNGKETRPYPNFWSGCQRWIDVLPEETEEERERKQTLNVELAELSARFGETPGLNGQDYIFSHPDLLHGNVIVRQPSGTPIDLSKGNPVTFIDYEYCCAGPAVFDLANHFAEWAGFELDYNGIPTRSQRRDFLKHYVGSFRYNSISDDETSTIEVDMKEDVEQLFEQVEAFRGLPGFFWGIWGALQAMISEIDFDYVSYSADRLAEYWAWKAEEDGSRKRKGEEMPLRERRWAED